MKYKILAAILAAITATTLCGCGESEKQDETTTVQASTQATTQAKTMAATTKAAPNTEAEASNVTQAEAETDAQAQPQEETAAETEAQSSQSAMTREEIISEVLSNTGAGEHAEYDIDKDGNPELIVNIGEGDAEQHCEVYIIGENGSSLAGSFASANTTLYSADDGLTLFYAHMGGYTYTTARLVDGALILTDEGGGRTEGDYPSVDGEEIAFTS